MTQLTMTKSTKPTRIFSSDSATLAQASSVNMSCFSVGRYKQHISFNEHAARRVIKGTLLTLVSKTFQLHIDEVL